MFHFLLLARERGKKVRNSLCLAGTLGLLGTGNRAFPAAETRSGPLPQSWVITGVGLIDSFGLSFQASAP